MTDAFIGLGASLGHPLRNLRLASEALAASFCLARASRIYWSPPAGGTARLPFLNAVVRVRTTLSPFELLAEVQTLETRLGRRPARRWADRVLDLDLLIYGTLTLSTATLQLPHPRLAGRGFALVPLLEVWPEAPAVWRSLALSSGPLPVVATLARLPRRPASGTMTAC